MNEKKLIDYKVVSETDLKKFEQVCKELLLDNYKDVTDISISYTPMQTWYDAENGNPKGQVGGCPTFTKEFVKYEP